MDQAWTPGKNATPIDTVIVTHRGASPYLAICVRRAAKVARRVVVLGDEANANLGVGEHHLLTDPSLQVELDEFRSIYQQVSRSHEFSIERFWVERWFLIRNFLRRENLDGCLAIDSDVLLFGDVAEDSLRFAAYAMTFGCWDAVRVVPHCNFIRGRETVADFCQYVMEIYRHPEKLQRLAELNRKKFNAAWISDMSLLASWGASSRFPIGYLENTVADGVGFDSCIDDTKTYVGCGYLPGILRQWKKLAFRDGVPYGTIRSSGLQVPMKCVHYHGPMKLLMDRHDQGQADDWSVARLMLANKFARYPNKFRLIYRNYIAPLWGGKRSSSAR
ncbi:MAG: hypothetical protein ACKPEY_10840 [Planctomycetota bacterium]